MKKGVIKVAFTLVELIVVITILAILGTIAFISLIGYSGKARDTKRKTDLSNIKTMLHVNLVKGYDILSFADDNTSIIDAGTGIQIAGRIGYATLSGSYSAGNINYNALGIKAEEFSDPMTLSSYKIGVTSFNNQYNLAATIENGRDIDTYVTGNWNPRTTTTFNGDGNNGSNIFYLSGSELDRFNLRVNDIVGISGGTYNITNIKNDKIYLNTPITTPGVTIFLKYNETEYLISRRDSGWKIRVGAGDMKYTPYKIR